MRRASSLAGSPLLSLVGLIAACAHPAPPAAPRTRLSPSSLVYPSAPRGDTVEDYGGTKVADPYRWLEDLDSSATRAFVAAENRLTFGYLATIPERPALRARLATLLDTPHVGLPIAAGGRTFYQENRGLDEQSILYVTDGPGAPGRPLLDPSTLSNDGSLTVAGFVPSPDGVLVAYGVSAGGSDWVEWRLRDVASGHDLPDRLPFTKYYAPSFARDGKGLYYSRFPAPKPGEELAAADLGCTLRYHALGTPVADDPLVYATPDHPDWQFSPSVTPDGRFLIVTIGSGEVGDRGVEAIAYQDLAAPKGTILPLVSGFDAEYLFLGESLDEKDGSATFYLQTTRDAPRRRIVAVDLTARALAGAAGPPTLDLWRTIVPEAAGRDTLDQASLLHHELVLGYLHDATSRVVRCALDGHPLGAITLPGLGMAQGFAGRPDSDETFYSFSSLATPETVYRFDFARGSSSVYAAPALPFDPAAYVMEEQFYPSKDGTKIPLFLAHRQGLVPNGRTAVLLYGYGGFGISILPHYSPLALAFMELGGIYALANLRGGGEYGEAWHRAGTLAHKQVVFDDFIAAAEWLVAKGYTTPARLAIMGGSNGGLLVGACLTQRPDLYGAAVASVGVMDMLRFDRFGQGVGWEGDYGSPHDPEGFKALYAYSPYQHVRPGTVYPATLITTGDHDSRVFPAHSYKFTAALQAAQAGPAPILLRVETRSGHGGGVTTSVKIDQATDLLAFLVRALDLRVPPAPAPSSSPPNPTHAGLPYPAVRKGATADDYFGTKVADPYRWMEDLSSAETKAFVEAERTLTEKYLTALPARAFLTKRITALFAYARQTAPVRHGRHFFWLRNDGLQSQGVLLAGDRPDASEGHGARVLLDPNRLSPDGTIALAGMNLSEDGTLLAYGLARAGSDWTEWRVRDVATGVDRVDDLVFIKDSSVAFTSDDRGLFYSRYPAPTPGMELEEANYDDALYYHALGAPQSGDLRIAGGDATRSAEREWEYSPEITSDGRWLVVSVARAAEPENLVFYADLARWSDRSKALALVPLVADFSAHYGLVDDGGPAAQETLWFETTDGAPRRRLIAIDTRHPARSAWRVLVPEGPDALVQVSRAGDSLFAVYLTDAHARVVRYGVDGRPRGEIALPGLGSVTGFAGERGDGETFYTFSSFIRPTSVYRYDLARGESHVVFAPKLLFDPDRYETRQIFATSKDGTRVPIFLSSRKGLAQDGKNPTLLYGYGGFDISILPSFWPQNVAWMELGGIYASATLRGGGEYGEAWHRAGMGANKQHVFDDFLAAAEDLVKEGYTSPARLAIAGSSNGGLLVGACLAERPDLFGAALPDVGVMDMLRFQKFTVGHGWVDEYGSSDDAAAFATLFRYSPLANIRPGTVYPATLITTADHDDRVVPAHSYKFAATLQAAQAGPAPILLRIESSAGHGAGKPTAKIIALAADRYAFLVQALGMELPSEPSSQPRAGEVR